MGGKECYIGESATKLVHATQIFRHINARVRSKGEYIIAGKSRSQDVKVDKHMVFGTYLVMKSLMKDAMEIDPDIETKIEIAKKTPKPMEEGLPVEPHEYQGMGFETT